MLWDVLQHYQIGEAQQAAQRAKHSANQAQRDTDDGERSIETLVLACQAMWELVKERDGLTDQTLLNRMREIDQRDGQVDGRITVAPTTCPSCGRVTGARTGRCVFCGDSLPHQPSPFAKR